MKEYEVVDRSGIPRPDSGDVRGSDWRASGGGPALEALHPEDLKKAPWLEFSGDDVEQTKAKLSALGVEEVAYVDKEHPYYATPGGPVFRLAKKS